MEQLCAQLRELAVGRTEWRVMDPDTKAYCMSFEAHEERQAREWLADHLRRFPNGPHARKVVESVRVLTRLEELALLAADRLQELAQDARRLDVLEVTGTFNFYRVLPEAADKNGNRWRWRHEREPGVRSSAETKAMPSLRASLDAAIEAQAGQGETK